MLDSLTWDVWASGVGALVAIAAAALAFVVQAKSDELIRSQRDKARTAWTSSALALSLLAAVVQIVGAATASGLVGSILIDLTFGLTSAVTYALELGQRFGILPLVVGATIGAGLFRLRAANKLAYGLLEIFFASTAMVVVVQGQPAPGPTALGIAFAGAIYVFVRGLTNLSEGLHPDKRAWFDALLLGHTEILRTIAKALATAEQLAEAAISLARRVPKDNSDAIAVFRVFSLRSALGIALYRAFATRPGYPRVLDAFEHMSGTLAGLDPYGGDAAPTETTIDEAFVGLRRAVLTEASTFIPRWLLTSLDS